MAKKRTAGRPAEFLRCKMCKKRMNTTEMRLHEPECRRSRLLKPGVRLHVKDKLVEIVTVLENNGAVVKAVKTGCIHVVRSPRAFREWMNSRNIRFIRKPKAAGVAG